MKRYILLCVATAMILASCSNSDESSSTTEEQHNYAVNSVAEREVLNPDDFENPEDIPEHKTITKEAYEQLKEIYGEDFDVAEYGLKVEGDDSSEQEAEPRVPIEYHTEDDKNADKITSLSEISIDDKIVKLPVTYDKLVETFGDSLSSEYSPETKASRISIDYTNDTLSNASFVFTSDEATTVDKMKCSEIKLYSGYVTNDSKMMSIALLGNIHFGSSFKDIIDFFGKPAEMDSDDEENENPTKFTLTYLINDNGEIVSKDSLDERTVKADDFTKKIYFSGVDSGLNYIRIVY